MARRRERVDSTESAVRVMKQAHGVIEPPANVPLELEDLPFFQSVIAEFARADWTAHQLELAAMLARKMADLAREQTEFRNEGSVVSTANGTPMANPRLQAIRMLDTSILATRRSLSLHALAGVDGRDAGKRKSKARKIEAEAPDDELFARPN